MISSPLVDLASLLLLASFFGWEIAFAYVVVGLILAVIGGTIIDKLHLENQVQDYVIDIKNQVKVDNNNDDIEQFQMSRKERVTYSKDQVREIINKVWLFVLIGVGIGAAIHNWIPEDFINTILGKNNPFSVLIAAFAGIPMYADIFGTLPIAEALYLKGVGIGTILTFMMGVTALSIPSIIMLSKVVKRKLLTIFVAIVSIGILIIGYLFNALSYILI